ncbi:CLUMA_CG017139, isoform A [Clunio marinus]|uniref:CLUMA_CG017139, isoform A n=1 Tax=Clunio marinus TaxID=568069 RepID=A0A1J1IUX9_9DIPT|nr:CLUMA_CG017139, isoform A [Clunio marinus]
MIVTSELFLFKHNISKEFIKKCSDDVIEKANVERKEETRESGEVKKVFTYSNRDLDKVLTHTVCDDYESEEVSS